MKRKLLCIELSSVEIRVCEVELSGKGNKVKLLNHFSVLSNNSISDTEIYEADSLAYTISSLLAENKIKTKSCIVCINSNSIYSRTMTLPHQNTTTELLELINAKVEEDRVFSAVDLQKSITTYSILDKVEYIEDEPVDTDTKKKKSKKPKKYYEYEVMLYNAPSSLVQGVIDLVKACKLKLVAINYAGNSIYQYIRTTHSKGTYLAVYLNDTNSILSVIKDGTMISQKTDSFSYSMIAKKLIEHQDITGCKTVEEALAFINEVRFFDDDYELNQDLLETQQDTFYYMRDEIIDDVVNFFNIISAYLASVRNTMQVDGIVYVCNNKVFPDLSESIKANVGIDVEILDEDKVGYPQSRLNCINSCISPINFNIEEDNKAVENKRFRQYMGVGLIFTVWMCGVYAGYNVITLQSLKSQNKVLEEKILSANEAQQVYNSFVGSTLTLETVQGFDKTSMTVLNDLDNIIKDMEKSIPTNKLHISSLSCTTESISLSATADSKDTVAHFIKELEGIEQFVKVDTMSVSESVAEDGAVTGFATGREVVVNIVCSFEVEEEVEEFEDEIVPEATEEEVE